MGEVTPQYITLVKLCCHRNALITQISLFAVPLQTTELILALFLLFLVGFLLIPLFGPNLIIIIIITIIIFLYSTKVYK